MAKRSNGRKTNTGKSAAKRPARKATKVRNTAIPKAAPVRNTAVPKAQPRAATGMQTRPPQVSGEITQDMIARRAYEIYLSGAGGSDFENWCRAERELRGL